MKDYLLAVIGGALVGYGAMHLIIDVTKFIVGHVS